MRAAATTGTPKRARCVPGVFQTERARKDRQFSILPQAAQRLGRARVDPRTEFGYTIHPIISLSLQAFKALMSWRPGAPGVAVGYVVSRRFREIHMKRT